MTRTSWPGVGALLAMVLLAAALVGAASAVTYGTANVDGQIGEWTDADILAPMYRAGDSTKKIESYAYLRYNCITGTAYVLVKTVDGVTALPSPDDAFVKVDGDKEVDGNTGDNEVPPDFQWVYIPIIDGDLRGFEGSFSVPPGAYVLDIHIQVEDDGSQTSALAGGEIGVTFNCDVQPPEPAITIKKYVSDDETTWNDAQTADGTDVPEISKDCPVYWKYVVENTGNVDLINLAVTDDQGVTPVRDETETDTSFNPGDIWTYYAEGTSTGAAYANTGRADAEDAEGTDVWSEDPAHYTGITP